MDPTTTIPPSSPSPPPPQNPHTPPDAIIDTTDCLHREAEPTSTNLQNLKSLVLKFAGRMLPAHQSLIQQRFDDIFPDELLVPNHPPYADMILTALWELKAEGGSNEEAISDFIKKEYHELPWAHATILNYHLKDLCLKGKITMTQDRCYQHCSSIPKPISTPNISPSSMSSTSSSSSDSLCSTPSSSSTSFCWVGGDKSKRKIKRKNTMGRGGKRVQVRGRGRGRVRPPKTSRVGQRGRSLGTIQQRKRRSFCNEVEVSEESQTEEGQVDVDIADEPKQATEVTSLKIEAVSIHDGETGFSTDDPNNVIIGQKVDEEWHENVNKKGESRGVRWSGRRKYKTVSDEEILPCEQVEGGTKEQEHKRKRYNVVWIGRRVRKLKEIRTDFSEDQFDDEVTELEEYVDKEKDALITGSDSDVVEQLKQKLVKVATDMEHNQPIENQLEDSLEKQNDIGGELKVTTDVEHNPLMENQIKDILEKQNDNGGELKVATDVEHNPPIENQQSDNLEKQNDMGGEQRGATDVEHNQPVENQQLDNLEKPNDIGEESKVATDVEHDQTVENQQLDILEKQNDIGGELKVATDVEHNKLTENQQSDILEKQNDFGRELKAATDVEHNQPAENQQSDILEKQNAFCGEQTDLEKQSKNDTDKRIHFHGSPQRESTDHDQLRKQEIQTADKQDSVMIQFEAQAIVTDVGKQEDDKVKALIWPEEQPDKGSEHEESIQQQEQCIKNREAESDKEQQTEVNLKENLLTIDTEVQHNLEMNKKETHARQACVVENVLEEQSNASKKHVQPHEQCIDRIQDSLRYCGQDWLEDRETVSAEEQLRQDEQQTEVNQKEIVLTIDTESQQDLDTNHARQACNVQNVSEELPNSSNEHVQPNDHCTEGDKLQLHEEQKSDVMEKVQLEGEVKVAEDEHPQYHLNLVQEKDIVLVHSVEQVQLEEVKAAGGECQQDQLNQVKEKANGLVHGVSSDQQDSVMTSTESEVEGDIEEHENPEVPQDQRETHDTVTSEVQPQQELQEGSEQRQPLRQGLRSSCKKEENQLERQTPIRRSLRHQKSVSEAAEVVEKESDHSEEQLKYSGRTRSSKREPKFSEAEQRSNLRKTRRTGL